MNIEDWKTISTMLARIGSFLIIIAVAIAIFTFVAVKHTNTGWVIAFVFTLVLLVICAICGVTAENRIKQLEKTE